MRAGEYLSWFAIAEDGAVAAGAGLWLMDWPAHMRGLSARRGNILNVYTVPEFRRRGLARRLMEAELGWCRVNGIDLVILHASSEGRALYESLGFQASDEMRIKLQCFSPQCGSESLRFWAMLANLCTKEMQTWL